MYSIEKLTGGTAPCSKGSLLLIVTALCWQFTHTTFHIKDVISDPSATLKQHFHQWSEAALWPSCALAFPSQGYSVPGGHLVLPRYQTTPESHHHFKDFDRKHCFCSVTLPSRLGGRSLQSIAI